MNARVEQLFHELVDLSREARAQYFEEHPVDEQTRDEVEALLAFDAGADVYLAEGVSGAARRSLPQLDSMARRCGPYRLLDIVGRGGMGAVYLAERADGEVTQRLAVKLLPAGAGDLQRERFLRERQILAALAHPNIARMLDAGHMENSQLFLAMEYIDGKPIDAFAAGLSVRQKITLFQKVCAAVAYLHRHLVVHRDLKPSNILVTADGEPKLLDFGIAKMLDAASDTTVTSLRMLTPDYASPEQVTGGQLSTATDIYSLGAVLYQLLTGRRAHEFENHSPEGIATVVTTREVTRPSKWTPELKGDLESILLKALRKDPIERYGTVEQLADDLRAFLESRTVRARSGNTWYRIRKFTVRHWMPVAASVLVIASLSVGLYIANGERNIAERRFQDVRQLSNKLFDIDLQVRGLPGSTKARQSIVDTSLGYLRRLRSDVRGDPELTLEVAAAYQSVAEVEGVSIGLNLGQTDKAERDLKTAEDLVQSVLVTQPANRAAVLRAALIAADLRGLARAGDRTSEELAWAKKTVERLEKFHSGPDDQSDAIRILTTYANAELSLSVAEPDEALRIGRRGSDIALIFHLPQQRASILASTAEVLRRKGDLNEALQSAHEAVTLLDPGAGEPGFAQAMNFCFASYEEGSILGEDPGISLGRPGEAVQVLERAYNLADVFVHRDPSDEASRNYLRVTGALLADIQRRSDPGRALFLYDHVLQHLAEIRNPRMRRMEASLLSQSSYALRSLGRPVEARQRLNTAFARLGDLKLYPADTLKAGFAPDLALHALADYEAGSGNAKRALEVYQGLLDRLVAGGANPESNLLDAMDLSGIWRGMAALHHRSGHPNLATTLELQSRNLWQQWDRKLPNNPFIQRQIAAGESPNSRR